MEAAIEVGPLDMGGVEAITPSSVQPLSESMLAVVDSYDPSIVLISAKTGKRIASFARKGHGPGEVQSIGPLVLLSDSILLIPDTQQDRSVLWDYRTNETTDLPLFRAAGDRRLVPSLVGYSAQYGWVTRVQPFVKSGGEAPRSMFDRSELILSNRDGVKPLLQLPSRSLVITATSAGDIRIGLGGLSPSVLAVCDSGVIVADSSGVRRHDFSGTVIEAHRHEFGWIPLIEEVARSYISAAVSRIPQGETRAKTTRLLEAQADRIERLFGGFFIAPNGSVWLRSLAEGATGLGEIGQGGRHKRTVSVPPGIKVVQVGVGYLIGMRITEDVDTPTFLLFRFTDSPSSNRSSWKCGKEYAF